MTNEHVATELTGFPPYARSKQLIKEAIMDNDFLKKLDSSQLREIVDSMYPKRYANGTFIIREGEVGEFCMFRDSGRELWMVRDWGREFCMFTDRSREFWMTRGWDRIKQW